MLKDERNSMTDVIDEIDNYIGQFDWKYSDWSIGIAKDPRKRLMQNEGVADKIGPWIYRMVKDPKYAQAIEKHFSETCGTDIDNDEKENAEEARVVYVYKKPMRRQPILKAV